MFYAIFRELTAFLTLVWTRLRRTGRENIPKSGGAVLVCNHLSVWDMITAACLTRRPIVFVGKKEIGSNPFGRFFANAVGAILIDRENPGISTLKEMIAAVEQGKLLLIFPEGTRNLQPEKVDLLPLHPGAAMVALRTGARVLPLWISGHYEPIHGLRIRCGEAIAFEGIEGTRKRDVDLAEAQIREALLRLRQSSFFN
ncbi:MAG: 1-acyl-sn-glycerol-3-phosphate acyltransferase [Christensenellaceae bacterium]|jgi:1-acyl-sn-glycerol-3-phosphate acyltransferase|nr:1-acyl-sn-glycerol-3-phosphate acyltransferase [Christensenellaceae bacterium]